MISCLVPSYYGYCDNCSSLTPELEKLGVKYQKKPAYCYYGPDAPTGPDTPGIYLCKDCYSPRGQIIAERIRKERRK